MNTPPLVVNFDVIALVYLTFQPPNKSISPQSYIPFFSCSDDHSLVAASVEDVAFVFGSPAMRSPKKRSAHFHLVEELVLKLNLDWVDHIENYYDESSEAVEEYLIYSTDIDETTWQELDVHEQTLPRQKALKPNHRIFTNGP